MPKCKAMTTRHGEPQQCSSWAMTGLEVCRVHGGASAVAKAAGLRRAAEAKAEEKAKKALMNTNLWNQNAEPTTDPIEELAALSGRLRDMVELLGSRLAVTDECPCCGISGLDQTAVLAFQKVLRESRTVLTDMARLGLEERAIRVDEVKAAFMVGAIRAALATVGIVEDDDQRMIVAREAAIMKIAELEEAHARSR